MVVSTPLPRSLLRMNVCAKFARLPLLPLALIAFVFGGCSSSPVSDSVPPSQALAGPYALRLSLDRPAASPGDIVMVSVEFENTGSRDLWIPRRREVFFGWEATHKGGTASAISWQSSCDGLEYVRVKPGRIVKYEKGFETPALYGEIQVFVTVSSGVKVPLVIKPRGV